MNLNNLPSPVESFFFKQKKIYVKRDELISAHFSGNKFRKLQYYLDLEPFTYTHILSYGGKQSNAMLSIAALSKLKNVTFTYYMRKEHEGMLLNNGNFPQAIKLGMQVKYLEASNDEELRLKVLDMLEDNELFIPQGGATKEASYGIKRLADEISQWKKENNIANLLVLSPSGTGTTVLYLHQFLKEKDIEVLTTPVVGDSEYLKEQMQRTAESESYPKIITTKKKYHFAKPRLELYKHYKDFLEQGLEIDLIYATVLFQALSEIELKEEIDLLYIHSGGLLGNESQLQRYKKILGTHNPVST